jgi:hypothetical protein
MKTWSFTNNPFASATEGNFQNALKISFFHDIALHAARDDPFFMDLYLKYHPVHLALEEAVLKLLGHAGIQQSQTLSLNQLLHLLSGSKIEQWDIKIQNQYQQDTIIYKTLLPHYRKPFQHGSQLERIGAVNVLGLAIGTDTNLAEVKADVDSFYNMLDAAMTVQKVSLISTKMLSQAVETARINMCDSQYYDLGALMQKFYRTPHETERFFDLETIRRNRQVVFTGHVKAGAVHAIVKHTFSADDKLLLVNNGSAMLKFYLGSSKELQPGNQSYTLAAGQETVLAGALGDISNTYLTVMNTDTDLVGAFEVEIL